MLDSVVLATKGCKKMLLCAPIGTTQLENCVQTGSGAHPASYPMGTGGEAAEAWSWLSSIICQGQEWRDGELIKHRENFTFSHYL
jgi:hypothetical protein